MLFVKICDIPYVLSSSSECWQKGGRYTADFDHPAGKINFITLKYLLKYI